MVFILETLVIGGAQEAQQLMNEKTKEIDAFLCVADDIDGLRIDEHYYLYKHIPIKDFQPIPAEKMAKAIEWIAKNINEGKTVMVFCRMGIGRSSSVIIGYLMSRGFGFGQAVEFVARKKPHISILPELITTIEEALEILNNK